MTKQKVLISWSGGKDSALALHNLLKEAEYHPVGLITTVNRDYDRVSIHGIRRSLLAQQATSITLPLHEVSIHKDASNEDYDSAMGNALAEKIKEGIKGVVFGDLFLEDIRDYREKMMSPWGLEGIFPLWGINTSKLAHQFIALGFKAKIAVVDTQLLDGDFAGCEYDHDFLKALPENIDPCGENGEFHTFVYDGPIFSHPINFKTGEVVFRENRFSFCDFFPTE
jgi:uncharacterized protein (TIGR00290 family)